MKKGAIAIDKWKLPIFSRHLVSSSYKYDEHPGPTNDTLFLLVHYPDDGGQALAQMVLAANTEAAKAKKPKK